MKALLRQGPPPFVLGCVAMAVAVLMMSVGATMQPQNIVTMAGCQTVSGTTCTTVQPVAVDLNGNIKAKVSGAQTAITSIAFANGTILTAPANGQFNVTNAANTAGIGFDVTFDGLLSIRNRAQNAVGNIQGGTIFQSGGGGGYDLNGAVIIVATAPTISSGFGGTPSVPTNNGTAAFTINVGTGGAATSGVIGMPTATNGWVVKCDDLTTQSATVFITKQIAASSPTLVTVANFNTAGAQAAWVANDILHCMAFGR